MIPLLAALVDDAGLFPPSSMPMADAVARHLASTSPMLTGRVLCPVDRVDELVLALGDDEKLEVHLIGVAPFALPDLPPNVMLHGLELRSGRMTQAECWVEGVAPKELAGTGAYGKVRCAGISVPALAAYVDEAARASVPFKATAGLHAAVRGWESTDGEPHHGYLNLLVAVSRVLSGGRAADALLSTDVDALVDEARGLSADLVTATRWLFRSYGSCDTARPVVDALRLGLL